jgi:hypothetical protein
MSNMMPVAGDTEMNETFPLSGAHGLVNKTKRYTTNSNMMWYGKCYTWNIIKYDVSTDGMINSMGEEGQAILWACMGNAIFKSIKYTLLTDDCIWVLAHIYLWKSGILWEENTNNFNNYEHILTNHKTKYSRNSNALTSKASDHKEILILETVLNCLIIWCCCSHDLLPSVSAIFLLLLLVLVLRIEPMASCMLGKCYSTELYSQLYIYNTVFTKWTHFPMT